MMPQVLFISSIDGFCMRIWKRIVSLVLVAAFVAGGIFLGDKLTTRGVSQQKYVKFFSEKQDYDVLFYGSSHVLSGIQPMELWKGYGITSYNLAGHAASLGMSYWVLRESLQYHKPKLVALDIYDMYAFDQPYMDISFMHYSLDAYPLSKLKYEAVQDLLRNDTTAARMELLFPFSVYHSRWNEVTSDSIRQSFDKNLFNPYCGSEARYGVAVPNSIDRVPAEDMTEGSEGADDYIKRFVETCRSEGIDICFIRVPYPASTDNQRAENRVLKLAEELKVQVIDMMYGVENDGKLSSIVVDWDTDLVDPNAHLNALGAYKVTRFLGEWFTRVYGFENKLTNPAYESWNEDYKNVYLPALTVDLKLQSDFKTCLMLAAYPEFETELSLTGLYKGDDVCDKLIKSHNDLITTKKVTSIGEDEIDKRAYFDLDGETAVTDPDPETLAQPVARMVVKNRETGEVLVDRTFFQ